MGSGGASHTRAAASYSPWMTFQSALTAAGSLSEEAFVTRFGDLADRATPVLSTFR